MVAQTWLPSVTGDGDAELPSSPRTALLPLPKVCRHNSLPEVDTPNRTRSVPEVLVTKIRSPQTTGVDPADPGMGSRQETFFSLLHWVGKLVSWLTPSLRGPRHCGQSSACNVRLQIVETTTSERFRSCIIGIPAGKRKRNRTVTTINL